MNTRLNKDVFRMAGLLARWLTGVATSEEKAEVERWRGAGHEGTAGRLERGEGYAGAGELERRFPLEEGWQALRRRLGWKGEKGEMGGEMKGRRVLAVGRWGRWGAAAAVLLAAGAGGWWLWGGGEGKGGAELPGKEGTTMAFAYRIEAGTTGARLEMGDGEVVEVDGARTFLAREEDGTLVVTDSAGTDYSRGPATGGEEVWNTVRTLTGMEYTVTLSDGTRVSLNAESRLRFPVAFKGGERRVELEGEGYFEVARDTARPFVVVTGEVVTRVLGTEFNARAYAGEGETRVVLARGRVRVFDGRTFAELEPGEMARWERASRRLEVEEVDVERATAWRRGRFVFRDERLEDVMATLARWYGVRYEFTDERARERRVGASLSRYSDMNPIVDMLRVDPRLVVTWRDSVCYIGSK